MVTCPECATESPDGSSFCRACGAALARDRAPSGRLVVSFDDAEPSAPGAPSPVPSAPRPTPAPGFVPTAPLSAGFGPPPAAPPAHLAAGVRAGSPAPPPFPPGGFGVPPALPPVYGGVATATSGLSWFGPAIAAFGGLLVAVGTALPWWRVSLIGTTFSYSAFRVPVSFLLHSGSAPGWSGDVKIGPFLLVLALGGIALSFVPMTSWPRRIIGALVLLGCAVYVIQVARDLSSGSGENVFDVVGAGTYVTAVGALLLIVPPSRR